MMYLGTISYGGKRPFSFNPRYTHIKLIEAESKYDAEFKLRKYGNDKGWQNIEIIIQNTLR